MGNCWPSPVVNRSPGTTKHCNPVVPNHAASTEQSKSTENGASLPLPPLAEVCGSVTKEEVPPSGRFVTPNLRMYKYAELETATRNFGPDMAEVKFLGKFSHPNLVKLLGYCWEGSQYLLVYEYMQKGSLESHLFRSIWFRNWV
ncbi:hypothetical protein RHGRI_015766 [Rhododendron griersonianum]|uniref:Serine-threonine/tyrosine-protein kinase catalytic domain-containing protein n=1 Tax=Rhododendron griersonianum TaxID=479676 RepID=A0AAV6JSB0_9ERIC|nr:hypothetical protein RHGRI_015766 [Rhododendron griersonianum]